MRNLILVLILALTGCVSSEKSNTSGGGSTPVADRFIANKANYIDENCGGVYSDECEGHYFYELYEALLDYYQLPSGSLVLKHCNLIDQCWNEYDAEYYFKDYDANNPFAGYY